jgi:nucleoside-diphosphate-sugar epimerase
MEKIIVTGASGFVGGNIISYFANNGTFQTEGLSLREKIPENLPSATAIIHLAGKAHDVKKASSPQEYFDVNFVLTQKLFDVFAKSDIRDFIYFSSVKAVADSVNGVLTEDQQADPKTAYGQSKRKAEEYLLQQALPKGKRLFILRPCMIHGPGNKGNLNLLYKVIQKGIPYPLGAFENLRSFLSIDNLLFVLENLLSKPDLPGGVYHLADDEPLQTTEVISIIGQAIHKRPSVWRIPPGIVRFLAKAGDLLRLPLTSERLDKLTESYIVGNQRIKSLLGVPHFPVTARDGLLKTLQSFNTNKP